MRSWTAVGIGVGMMLVLISLRNTPIQADQPVKMNVAAPEFDGISAWINSKPLKMQDLRGKVVVLHFWTFG